MDQEERLAYLVRWFAEDSGEYRDVEIPRDEEGKRRLLRGLMNIRLPRPVPPEVLAVQDAYLTARAEEKGIVPVDRIAPDAGDPRLALWQGDITRLACDAVVNAANSRMLGCFVPLHTCIDNTIQTFAGVQMRLACARYMDAKKEQYGPEYEEPTGKAMLTEGYNLPSRYVVHTVGPIVASTVTDRERNQLASCYTSVLDCCLAHGLGTVAFCCISTGVFRYPPEAAARTAVATVKAWLDAHPGAMRRVVFNVYKDSDLAIYRRLLEGGN